MKTRFAHRNSEWVARSDCYEKSCSVMRVLVA